MKISGLNNSMFTITANEKKEGDWDLVKKVAEMFYDEGFDGAEMGDEYEQFITICNHSHYQSSKKTNELYKEFKRKVTA